MNQNKICPHCEVEYLPHIEQCADCGAALLLYEECRRSQEEKKHLMAKAFENAVVVREGDLNWLGRLHDVLIDNGIPCAVISDASCKKGSCRNTCRLIVSKEDTEKAQECITEYYMEIHPELRASNELLTQGKCPACGSPVGPSDNKCSDCGLTLVIIEEENQEADTR
jgi:hypothetical protein